MATTRAGGTFISPRSRPRMWAISRLAWVFQTNQTGADQIVAAAGGRHSLLHGAGQRVGRGRALGPHDLALSARPATQGDHIGHRGVAMYKGWLYFTTPDAHLISLDAKDGKVRWDKVVADVNKGYWTTMAPLVIRGHVHRGSLRATSIIFPAICARSMPRPARRNGSGTPRHPRARQMPPPAARCG